MTTHDTVNSPAENQTALIHTKQMSAHSLVKDEVVRMDGGELGGADKIDVIGSQRRGADVSGRQVAALLRRGGVQRQRGRVQTTQLGHSGQRSRRSEVIHRGGGLLIQNSWVTLVRGHKDQESHIE